MGIRAKSHKVAYQRRRLMASIIERDTPCTCELRGGEDTIHFIYTHMPSLKTRVTTQHHKVKPDGLDMFVRLKGETIWASFFPEYKSQRKMVPNRSYLRVKAPNPGVPKTLEEIEELFALQWVIIARFLHREDREPFQWQAVKMKHIFEIGYPRGFYPTGEKGRPSTVRLCLAEVACHIHTLDVGFPGVDPLFDNSSSDLKHFFETIFREERESHGQLTLERRYR
jgi:hypothetical protein